METKLEIIASKMTLYFIGYKISFKEICDDIERDLIVKFDLNLQKDVDHIKKHCNSVFPDLTIKTDDDINLNPTDYAYETFKFSRGSFEKEKRAVLSELSFWYEEKK
jgi:hypothetical protein